MFIYLLSHSNVHIWWETASSIDYVCLTLPGNPMVYFCNSEPDLDFIYINSLNKYRES